MDFFHTTEVYITAKSSATLIWNLSCCYAGVANKQK